MRIRQPAESEFLSTVSPEFNKPPKQATALIGRLSSLLILLFTPSISYLETVSSSTFGHVLFQPWRNWTLWTSLSSLPFCSEQWHILRKAHIGASQKTHMPPPSQMPMAISQGKRGILWRKWRNRTRIA